MVLSKGISNMMAEIQRLRKIILRVDYIANTPAPEFGGFSDPLAEIRKLTQPFQDEEDKRIYQEYLESEYLESE